MTAAIELGFDPLLRLGDLAIRLQTLGLTAALLAGLALVSLRVEESAARGLRHDQLLLILVGIVPGAVAGGRIVHVVAYLEVYLADPLSIVDPRAGGLSLLGAVLGGIAGALYVVRLLRASAPTWADVAAVPMLLSLGIGKVAQLLGGSGQGLPFTGPWAVAFEGTGPWIGANVDLPSHPSQLYEGLWLLIGIPALRALAGWRSELRQPAIQFVGALCWFLLGRVLVGFTWRDQAVLGPLNAEQVMALLALAATLGLAFRRIVRPTERQPLPAAREPMP